MLVRMGRVLGYIIVLIVTCLLLLRVLPGPWLARQAQALASSYYALPVEMGSLQIRPFSLAPGASIESLGISQAPDAARLHVDELTVTLDLLALTSGESLLDRLHIINGGVDLRIDEQGVADWMMPAGKSRTESLAALRSFLNTEIDEWLVDSFDVNFVNDQSASELSLTVDGVVSTHDARKSLQAQIEGHANGQPVNASAEVSASEADDHSPVALSLQASVGDDQIAVNGSVKKSSSLYGVLAKLDLQISSPAQWQPFFAMRLPDLPPFALAGELRQDNKAWQLREVEGHFGKTDFSGDISADLASQPVTIDTQLLSGQLAIDELLQWWGHKPIPVPMNASIDIRAEQVLSDSWPIDHLDLLAVVDDTRLSVDINRIGLPGGGELDGVIVRRLDSQPPVTQLELNLKRFELQSLLSAGDPANPRVGQMAARVDLSMTGETLASLSGSVDGKVVALMTGDWMITLLERLLGVEQVRSLINDRGVSDTDDQDCAFMELQATDGMVAIASLVLDTNAIVYLGDGGIDGKNQRIDMILESHFKRSDVVADAVHVSGALSLPILESAPPFRTRDTAVRVLDATITPAVSLMPFIGGHSSGAGVVCQGMAGALDDPQ